MTSAADLDDLAGELGIDVWTFGSERDQRWARIRRAARESLGDRLPPRYATDTWHIPFRGPLAEVLVPGVRVLDVGAGIRPMIPPEARPEGCHYVGFDIDAAELAAAPAGSYADTVVGDVCALPGELVGEFDVVLSWLTMEHVRPVDVAIWNLRSCLRPGGRFLGYLAGRHGAHAVINRVVPERLARRAMQRLMGRDPTTVFRAYYDQCWFDRLDEIAAEAFTDHTVVPLFTGGWYWRFSPVLRAPYLAYEEWAYTGDRRNLASYYLVDGRA